MFSLYLLGFCPGYSKLSVSEIVSVDGCFSLYVSPLMNWQHIQGVPIAQRTHSSSPTSWEMCLFAFLLSGK